MRRIVFGIVLLMSALVSTANAQTREPRIIECPASQVNPLYQNYKVWDKDHVNVRPVIPELYGKNQLVVQHYIVGPTPDDKDQELANIVRGHARLQRLMALEGFTSFPTDLDKAPTAPPKEFIDDLYKAVASPEGIHYKVVPCGETVFNYLSWAEDDMVNVIAEPGPWRLGWCEEGVYAYDGRCGIEVMDTDSIPIKSGINEGNEMTVRIVMRCGNPEMFLSRIKQTSDNSSTVIAEAPPPPPAPPPQALVIPKNLPPQPETIIVPEKKSGRIWCAQKWWKGTFCAAPAVALLALRNHKEPTSTAFVVGPSQGLQPPPNEPTKIGGAGASPP